MKLLVIVNKLYDVFLHIKSFSPFLYSFRDSSIRYLVENTDSTHSRGRDGGLTTNTRFHDSSGRLNTSPGVYESSLISKTLENRHF